MDSCVYLRVVSEKLRPVEISKRLGVEPDEARAVGSFKPPNPLPRRHTTWIRWVVRPGGKASVHDVDATILAWGQEFAAALGRLVEEANVWVALTIVQAFDVSDGFDRGISLEPDVVAWLATAKAALDVDQYIPHECSEEK